MAPTASIPERLLAGERAALARMISWAEDGDERFPAALAKVYDRVGRSFRTGITGPPGAGKSTLVNELARLLRERERTVAVLAVDPSSPYSGGALLGDRIRMEDRTLDPGVFIRSMASRGSHGGLARATIDACDAMDAFGFDELIVETVGVGQAEYDVVSAADSVVVVLCPGAGDGIQAMKAGLLEVADVLVVNKSDVRGADQLVLDLEESVHIRGKNLGSHAAGKAGWNPLVISLSAGRGEGVDVLIDALERHRAHLAACDLDGVRRAKRVEQVKQVVSNRLETRLWGEKGWGERIEALLVGGATPYDVSTRVVAALLAAVSSVTTEETEDDAHYGAGNSG